MAFAFGARGLLYQFVSGPGHGHLIIRLSSGNTTRQGEH